METVAAKPKRLHRASFVRELSLEELNRVSGADMKDTMPGECGAGAMVGAAGAGAVAGAISGIEGGPVGMAAGAVFGAAIGAAGAAFTCAAATWFR